jgi:hypothetical protein
MVWKLALMAYFKTLPQHLPDRTEESHKKLEAGYSVSWPRFKARHLPNKRNKHFHLKELD